MAIRFLGRPIQIAGGVLAVGTVIAAVGCQTGSYPTAPSSESAGAAVVGSSVGAGGGVAQAQAPTLNMCHVMGHDRFQLINISANAELAHLDHGDGYPGGPVPRKDGHQFNNACEQELIPIPTATKLECSCWNNYSKQELLGLLNVSAVGGGGASCFANSTIVWATPNSSTWTPFVFATGDGCQLRLNGSDTGYRLLPPEQANQCVAEAASFIPDLNWCPH